MKLYIARDKSKSLWLYYDKPVPLSMDNNQFSPFLNDEDEDILIGELESTLFPEITFENSPQQVELKLINKL